MRWARYRPTINANAASVLAPSIAYTGSPFTWYDYYTSVSLSVTNTGGAVTSYAVSAGALPTGVSLNSSTGAITGTPTALKTAANVTITATGPGGTSDAVLNIAVLWFPSSLGTLIAGYDTEAGFSTMWQDSARTTAANDTDPCGALDDLSGNGNHVLQATAGARPTVNASGVNSKRALSFDGGDFLALAAFASGDLAQARTVALIVKAGATGASYVYLDSKDTAKRHQIYEDNASPVWGLYSGVELLSVTATNTNLHLHVTLANGASSAHYLDGTSIASGNAGSQAMAGITLGANWGGASHAPNGTFEVFAAVWSGDIGSTARTNLKTWAIAKWGTPA